MLKQNIKGNKMKVETELKYIPILKNEYGELAWCTCDSYEQAKRSIKIHRDQEKGEYFIDLRQTKVFRLDEDIIGTEAINDFVKKIIDESKKDDL
jgi:hypothetical protein